MKTWLTIVAMAVLLTLSVSCSASQKTTVPAVPADYYKGKVIELVVPSGTGGGADNHARLVAKYLPNFIPGNPTIVVRNMGGGGSLEGNNYVYNQAKKDGLTLVQGLGAGALLSMLRFENANFDYGKMLAIMGGAQSEVQYARAEIIKDPAKLRETKGLVYGNKPMPGSISFSWVLGKELIGFESKDVLTYGTGGNEVITATLSKEVNCAGIGGQLYNSTLKPYVTSGEMIPLWQSGVLKDGKWVRSPVAGDAMTFIELYQKINNKAPSGKTWDMLEAYQSYIIGLTKHVMLAPGNEAYAQILREAATKMLQDPTARADFEKLSGGETIYVGAEAQQVLDYAAKKTDPMVKTMQEWVTKGWGTKFAN